MTKPSTIGPSLPAMLAQLLLALPLFSQGATTRPKSAAERSLLARVVTIGASLTSGAAAELPLAKILDLAIAGEHRRVQQFATELFFMKPRLSGKAQIDRCVRRRPTLVLGIDFLFWYGYGQMRGTDEIPRRLRLLEEGLEQLARLDCPIVVGDFPDMRGADPRMLSPVQVPSKKALAALNARLASWVREHPNVRLVPLAAWVEKMKAGEWRIAPSKDGRHGEIRLNEKLAMTWDRLHPTKLGEVALCAKLVAELRRRFGKRADGFRFDAWEAIRKLGLSKEVQASASRPARPPVKK